MKPFVTALLALAIAACGTGKAIFNVDAYSFMSGTGRDTIHYAIPTGGGTASTVQKINLPPGFGKSIVDSVRIRIAAVGTNGGVTPVSGKGVLTALVIRVVVEDRIF